jgi:hypothetical protein
MRINVTRVFVFCLVVAFVVAATVPSPAQAQVTGLLAKVKERGKLLCGVNTQLPGFGFLDKTDNTFKGFDTDFCRVLAAGLFGDLSKVEFIPVPAAADRFPKLASGDIDVLIRNTTFTFGRDTKEGGEFMPTTLYDGSSILVKASTKYAKLEDFKDPRSVPRRAPPMSASSAKSWPPKASSSRLAPMTRLITLRSLIRIAATPPPRTFRSLLHAKQTVRTAPTGESDLSLSRSRWVPPSNRARHSGGSRPLDDLRHLHPGGKRRHFQECGRDGEDHDRPRTEATPGRRRKEHAPREPGL